jgi:hypothetical protein
MSFKEFDIVYKWRSRHYEASVSPSRHTRWTFLIVHKLIMDDYFSHILMREYFARTPKSQKLSINFFARFARARRGHEYFSSTNQILHNSLLINRAPSQKLIATIQFTTKESRNKVAANKSLQYFSSRTRCCIQAYINEECSIANITSREQVHHRQIAK